MTSGGWFDSYLSVIQSGGRDDNSLEIFINCKRVSSDRPSFRTIF